MKIILNGCCGKMGRAVARYAALSDDISIACGIDLVNSGVDFPVYTTPEGVTEEADLVVDFSRPEGTLRILQWCVAKKLPLILATTGLDRNALDAIKAASETIPVFHASNFSLGVYVLNRLSAEAASALTSFDCEITEIHHNQKVDAPSGTALTLAASVQNAREGESPLVMGRTGKSCKRAPGDIGMHSLRGGTIAGEHSVAFFGEMESVTLSHSAQSRDVFAVGALSAARFLVKQGPGLYGMSDMMRPAPVKRKGLMLLEGMVSGPILYNDTLRMMKIEDRTCVVCAFENADSAVECFRAAGCTDVSRRQVSLISRIANPEEIPENAIAIQRNADGWEAVIPE